MKRLPIRSFGKPQQKTDRNMIEALSDKRDTRDTIVVRLLDECIKTLSEQGMQRLFVDAVRGGDEGFQSTGK